MAPGAGRPALVFIGFMGAGKTSAARAAAADLGLFLAAETARDTLAAPHLAGALFRQVADDWPESPYTPKALLALGLVDSVWADSARALLTTRYAASPYVAYVQGTSLPEYQSLEDSLRAFSLRAQSRPRPVQPTRPGQPAGRRQQPNEPDGQMTPRRRRELVE